MQTNNFSLTADGKKIELNNFAKSVLESLNLAFISQLRKPKALQKQNGETAGKSENLKIKSFKIDLIPKPPAEKPVKSYLWVNDVHFGMKPWVQNILFGFNMGIIETLKGYYADISKYTLIYN